MLIALDARTIYRDHRRGIGKSLLSLYHALWVLRPEWRVLALHRCADATAMKKMAPANFYPLRIEMPGDRLDAWERVRLPLAAWRGGATLMHCPANAAPLWLPMPAVVTVHDLLPMDLPQGRSPEAVARFTQSVRHACAHARSVICPSKYTADRLVQDMNADPGRLTVIPWAADTRMAPQPALTVQSVLHRMKVHGPMVLHLGAREERKNTRRLLEAWAMIPPALRRTWQLLIVGLDDLFRHELQLLIHRQALTSQVRLHGFVSDEEMASLFQAAEVLAYPSLGEGFGLPILDAFASGTAVLTGQLTSLPEVAGDAALLVDAHDVTEIASGLGALMSSTTYRGHLVARGRLRLADFTWEKTAQAFASVLEDAAEHATTRRSVA